jgi:hypothetical protein
MVVLPEPLVGAAIRNDVLFDIVRRFWCKFIKFPQILRDSLKKVVSLSPKQGNPVADAAAM